MFIQPEQLEEALAIKARMGSETTLLAGGTDLVVLMNRDVPPPAHVTDLTHVKGFEQIERHNGQYRIGGGSTFAQLGRLPIRSLSEASLSVGGPQIRNRGTIAGNLATASPAGDGSVALLGLDAEVEMTHAVRGHRRMNLRDFFLDYRKTALQPDEIITSISFPADWTTAWYKIGKRGAVNISLVCCAIGRSPAGEFAVAFGSVAPFPMRAPETERLLNGQELTDDLIEHAGAAAMREVAPIDDFRASADYRRSMCGALTRRLLREMRERAASGG